MVCPRSCASSQGWYLPWETIVCLLPGMIFGARLGALLANRLSKRNLKIVQLGFTPASDKARRLLRRRFGSPSGRSPSIS